VFDPKILSQMVNLEEINLVHLDMWGYISDDFVKNLKKLRYLNLANNNLEGTLPDVMEWADMKELKMIELQNNSFTGDIP